MKGEGVYDRIKARLLAEPLPPGQPLYIGVLADELRDGTPYDEFAEW